jgi:hypothetical protein
MALSHLADEFVLDERHSLNQIADQLAAAA